jgi:hypothetical protein
MQRFTIRLIILEKRSERSIQKNFTQVISFSSPVMSKKTQWSPVVFILRAYMLLFLRLFSYEHFIVSKNGFLEKRKKEKNMCK